jgi:nucleoside-diphosphate-sugar epimerase
VSNGLSNKSQAPILVTGAAGFIGAKTVELLLAEGHTVVGVDNLNDFYDVRLKNYRLNTLLAVRGPQIRFRPKPGRPRRCVAQHGKSIHLHEYEHSWYSKFVGGNAAQRG